MRASRRSPDWPDLRDRVCHGRLVVAVVALDRAPDRGRADRSEGPVGRCLAGTRAQGGRSPLAEAEARAPLPGGRAIGGRCAGRPQDPLQLRADFPRAAGEAGDVVADVDDSRRPGLEGKQRIEAGHPVGLGGWHAQPTADLVERRLADPADARLDGMERRQEEVTSVTCRMPSPGAVAVEAGLAWPGDRLDRGALDRTGQRADDVEIHRRRV